MRVLYLKLMRLKTKQIQHLLQIFFLLIFFQTENKSWYFRNEKCKVIIIQLYLSFLFLRGGGGGLVLLLLLLFNTLNDIFSCKFLYRKNRCVLFLFVRLFLFLFACLVSFLYKRTKKIKNKKTASNFGIFGYHGEIYIKILRRRF